MTVNSGTYLTVKNSAEGLFKDRGSRFISLIHPIDSEEQVKEILFTVRKKYHDATHHCYAYALGINRELSRQNDDGEPSGTAGKPIYGQILSKNLTNVLIVVVRYFGGTKLGVSGLINAYREAAVTAISNASIIEKTLTEKICFLFDYKDIEKVMKAIKGEKCTVLENHYEQKCFLRVEVRKKDSEKLKDILKEYLFTE